MELRVGNERKKYSAEQTAIPAEWYGPAVLNTPAEQDGARRRISRQAQDRADEGLLMGLLGLLAAPVAAEPLGPHLPPTLAAAMGTTCRGKGRHVRTMLNTKWRVKSDGKETVECKECSREHNEARLKHPGDTCTNGHPKAQFWALRDKGTNRFSPHCTECARKARRDYYHRNKGAVPVG